MNRLLAVPLTLLLSLNSVKASIVPISQFGNAAYYSTPIASEILEDVSFELGPLDLSAGPSVVKITGVPETTTPVTSLSIIGNLVAETPSGRTDLNAQAVYNLEFEALVPTHISLVADAVVGNSEFGPLGVEFRLQNSRGSSIIRLPFGDTSLASNSLLDPGVYQLVTFVEGSGPGAQQLDFTLGLLVVPEPSGLTLLVFMCMAAVLQHRFRA